MQPIPFTLTNDAITVIIDGAPKVIHQGGAQYTALRSALFNEQWEEALELTKSPAPALSKYLFEAGLGAFTLDGTTLKLGDKLVPADITGRIDAMLTRGESPVSLLRFFERLQKNPSWRSVNQLFPFLQAENIPIEADGTFLAYKGVNQNLTDKHSGTIDNTPGRVVKMPRNEISDDPSVTCHFGLHVCSKKYLSYFGAGRTVIVRVSPENVVCIPEDHNAQKMRVCEYEVVGHYTGQPLPSTSVTAADVIDDEFDDSDEDYSDDVDEESETDAEVRDAEEAVAGDDEAETFAKEIFNGQLTADEKALVTAGNIIGAIKAIRVRIPGTGLRECKDAVDEERELQKAWGVKPGAAEQTTPPRKGRTPVTTEMLGNIAKLPPRELLDCTIDALRAYAAQLKIVGASKLPGGKVALIKQISKARRR